MYSKKNNMGVSLFFVSHQNNESAENDESNDDVVDGEVVEEDE